MKGGLGAGTLQPSQLLHGQRGGVWRSPSSLSSPPVRLPSGAELELQRWLTRDYIRIDSKQCITQTHTSWSELVHKILGMGECVDFEATDPWRGEGDAGWSVALSSISGEKETLEVTRGRQGWQMSYTHAHIHTHACGQIHRGPFITDCHGTIGLARKPKHWTWCVCSCTHVWTHSSVGISPREQRSFCSGAVNLYVCAQGICTRLCVFLHINPLLIESPFPNKNFSTKECWLSLVQPDSAKLWCVHWFKKYLHFEVLTVITQVGSSWKSAEFSCQVNRAAGFLT